MARARLGASAASSEGRVRLWPLVAATAAAVVVVVVVVVVAALALLLLLLELELELLELLLAASLGAGGAEEPRWRCSCAAARATGVKSQCLACVEVEKVDMTPAMGKQGPGSGRPPKNHLYNVVQILKRR